MRPLECFYVTISLPRFHVEIPVLKKRASRRSKECVEDLTTELERKGS